MTHSCDDHEEELRLVATAAQLAAATGYSLESTTRALVVARDEVRYITVREPSSRQMAISMLIVFVLGVAIGVLLSGVVR